VSLSAVSSQYRQRFFAEMKLMGN